MTTPAWLEESREGVILSVYVQPGARAAGPAGTFDGLPKLRLRSRAREGRANKELLQWLSSSLGVPTRDTRILSGRSSRRKKVEILGDVGRLRTAVIDLFGEDPPRQARGREKSGRAK